MMLLQTDAYYQIGGWPEDLVGWGGEDDIISHKISKLLTNKSFPHSVYHLPHYRSVYDWSDHPEFQNNCEKMNRILRLSDSDLVLLCSQQKELLIRKTVE